MPASDISMAALATLDGQHLQVLQDTVRHILFTQRAEYVFAQVVDGVPTKETKMCKNYSVEELFRDRAEPSPEALDLVRGWRSDFQLTSLEIDDKVLRAYTDSQLGTREYKLRLIEITAVVVHTLAALLFQHTNQPPYKCPPPRNGIVFVEEPIEVEGCSWIRRRSQETDELIPSPHPTYLYHNHYRDYDIYPMGVADMVAYWAETHLFGGVVVFEHGESDTEFLHVWLHPDANLKVFRLSETQIDQFVSFGLYGEPTPAVSPFLPIKAERNTFRVLGEYSLQYNIYRSRGDRKVPVLPRGWHPRGRLEDDPQMMDVLEMYRRGELKPGHTYQI
ncbi:hypothetical protein BJX99DRAFT_93364 [Aspergillus californicus]